MSKRAERGVRMRLAQMRHEIRQCDAAVGAVEIRGDRHAATEAAKSKDGAGRGGGVGGVCMGKMQEQRWTRDGRRREKEGMMEG